MKFLTISGWGQAQNSLNSLVPEGEDEQYLNYVEYQSYAELSSNFKDAGYDAVISWSLGTQIAMRLISEKKLHTKLLIMLAPPFQFVADSHYSNAMNSFIFLAFRQGFKLFPAQTLKRFSSLIAFNDSATKQIINDIKIDESNHINWLKWLDEIGNFSCSSIGFVGFPQTIIIHGDGDAVVDYRQTEYFKKPIKNLQVNIFENSGHAPHLHDSKATKQIINSACNLIKK